jgi:hypothetical protein
MCICYCSFTNFFPKIFGGGKFKELEYAVSEGKSYGRVAECTRPNPKMRRGPKQLPVWRIRDEHKRTRGIIVVQATGA